MNATCEEDFEEALQKYLKRTQEISDALMEKHFPSAVRPVFSLDRNRRYVRVVTTAAGSRSVHVFIDTSNGNVLKPAGWKGPAKGVRGNIFQINSFGAYLGGGLYDYR